MNRSLSLYIGLWLAVMIGLVLSRPVVAAETDPQSLPLSFSTRQLPAWAEEGWLEYRTERSAGRLKEASDVLAKIRKLALLKGVQRFDFASAVLIQEGEEALSKGKLDEAIELGEAAQAWSPNNPNTLFFLAKVQFHQHPFSPTAAFGSYVQGLSAGVSDFWFLFYSAGGLVLALFAGLSGAFMVFFIVMLVRRLPMLVHSLHELSSVVLNRTAVWVLVGTLLMTPFFLGAGAGIVLVLGICLVWLNMKRSERIISVLLIFLLTASSIWLPMMLSWFTADQSTELILMSDVLHGDAAASGSAQMMEAQGGYERNWPVNLSLAVQKRREGNYADALERYLLLRKQDPDRASVLNNIGNIYFLMKQYDEAVTYYKQSLEKGSRDAISHYNLSLVYRDMLRFNDAKQEIDTAQQINLSLIESFQGVGPIDALFSERSLWETAFAGSPYKKEMARNLFGSVLAPFSLESTLILPVLFSAGLILMRLLISRKVAAAECALCGRSICFHCQRRILDLKTCSSCWNRSKNVKRKSDLRQLKIRQRWILKLAQWSSVLPGAGHIFIGEGIRGLCIAAVFLGMIFTVLFQDQFFHLPGGRGGVFGFVGILAVGLGFAVFYILVFLDLLRGSYERL